ncbi:MAG: hypothetical protein FJZ47_23175 [Candidatus Tectomicrobia bacterium]|uniref:Uncharacterized protein n=1 Tax=Tectimicrobiota bacterium TaxID=2528274 RepID=A0A938B6G7_UNCTE|nr:hypothetical protein [Candidatus Tectomicrobia bacterium]
MEGILKAVLALVYVVVVVVVLYRVLRQWLTGEEPVDPMILIANALSALVVFAVLGILHAVAGWYGILK